MGWILFWGKDLRFQLVLTKKNVAMLSGARWATCSGAGWLSNCASLGTVCIKRKSSFMRKEICNFPLHSQGQS